MPRRDLNLDEERRSYAGLWLLGAALLCVGAIWTVMDDTFLRRPWKEFQTTFFRMEKERELQKLEAEEKRLAEDAKVQELRQRLDEASAQVGSRESAAKLESARGRLAAAQLDEGEADIQVRFVKSSLEEAWYEYDHALETGGNVNAARERRDLLMKEKVEREATWEKTKADVARIQGEIDEIEAPQKKVQKELETAAEERERIANKIEGMKTQIGAISVERIPVIEQIVLPDFDINNFEQPVDRVDRCTSCHIGIDKAGFEELAQPLTTHPRREVLLGKHPIGKFGCTSCHDGQGVAVNSPEQAHGDVPFWLHPLLRDDQMQARCLDCHRDVARLDGAAVLARGEYLFEQLGCHGCHLVEGYEDIPHVAPSLRRIAAKVDPAWLVGWVHNPYDFRPRTRMPNFLFSDEQARAAAAYLWTSSKADGEAWLAAHPDPGGISSSDAAQVALGKELFESVGCRACHAIAPDEVATPIGAIKDYAPNLQNVARKTSARFVYWWIKDPRGYNPESRMPSLRLTDDEARAITAYLMSLAEPPAPGPITAATLEDPALAEQGKAIVRKYGCYGCHAINGMDAESRIGVELSTFASKPLEELFFGNNPEIPRTWNAWTFNKLKNPRIYATEHVEQLMPNFMLAEEDINALRVWLQSRTEGQAPLDFRAPGYEARQRRIQAGRRVIERYNCQGCHQIDGKGGFVRRLYEENPTSAPPILNAEGSKVQPEWFYGFLQDPARQPLRFWLKIRMPTFGLSAEETTQIVDYFTATADLKDPYFFWNPTVDSTPVMLQTGERLMSDEYFSCWSCHVRGSETPEGPQEQWAPNLAYARERLNPHWILEWIKDPQALMPGTKMPAFYPGGPEDVFEGNEAKQIMAMRDYIMSLGGHGTATTAVGTQQPAAAPAPAQQPAAAPAPGEQPGADRVAGAEAKPAS
jgi:mono/diheme cytochrome c family protein